MWHTADSWHEPQSCSLCSTYLSWVQFWERGQMLLKITSFCLGITSCLHTIVCHRLFIHLIFMYVVVTACAKQLVVLHVLIIVSRCFTVLLHCDSHFIFLSWKINISFLYPGGAQSFQKSRSHLKVFGARRVTLSMFHSEDPQILGTTSQNLVTQLPWFTRVNKNPSALNFLSPKLEVTCGTVAIIIRAVLLSPYLRIRAVSLSSIHYNQSHRIYILTEDDNTFA